MYRRSDETRLRGLLAILRYRLSLLLFYCVTIALTFIVQYLAGQNLIYARYTVLLMSFFLVVILFFDGVRLHAGGARCVNCRSMRPRGNCRLTDALQADYIKALAELSAAYDGLKARLNAAHGETLEYYTPWVHQIKRPSPRSPCFSPIWKAARRAL